MLLSGLKKSLLSRGGQRCCSSTASLTAAIVRRRALSSSSSSSLASSSQLKVALCQIAVGADKQHNLSAARDAVRRAADAGAELVVLPECFNSVYDTAAFPVYAEPVPDVLPDVDVVHEAVDEHQSPSLAMLSATAKECGVVLVGGSVPERVGEHMGEATQYFNTSTVWDARGALVAKHRKVNLFDIDIPGKIRFMESDVLSPGERVTTFEVRPGVRAGLAICFDIRFPLLAREMAANDDVKLLIYPGAFNTTTGPLHWELLQRARAVDNQVFVMTASPARSADADYQAWGHSTLVDPWGAVLATCDHEEALVLATIDTSEVDAVRQQIPVRDTAIANAHE
eukprot:TRINITY_DN70172_c0_g1_i1.p1 TRINITY_DN70172_c0_g1~~TRINITY_DN70172_c0_g1_i1.p1  ORF type:complete len:341 (-),score=121.44 TRINITY_DN70172_c0_g1_i1:50-1072(-)